jgi:predicted esterase
MLILLHGFGANERDLLPMAARLDPRLAVASLRGPYQIHPGSYSWVNRSSAEELHNARRIVIECIDQVADSTGADRSRGTGDQQIPVRSAHDIRQALKPMGVAVDHHEFESGHYISDVNVDVLNQWLRRRLATK